MKSLLLGRLVFQASLIGDIHVHGRDFGLLESVQYFTYTILILQVPDLELSESMEENVKNEDLMSQIEETCRGWNKQVSAALDAQQKKVGIFTRCY